MNPEATVANKPACFLVNGGRVQFNSTHEYQRRIQVVVILLVEVFVVFVRLLVEHLVEMPTGIHIWWFI